MKSQTQIELLDFLIGKWNSEGVIILNKKDPEIAIKGTDTYEWTLDGAFLLHTVDVHMGEERVKVIELISYDKSKGSLILRSFDNTGKFTKMKAVLKNGQLKISGNKMRSTLTIIDGDQMSAKWEKQKGTKWIDWMEMKFIKEDK